ncbi:MAG: hypothetical protein DCC88_07410 [Spirobacillus cienkowskii]|jgi:hypothetical protein|uniref:Uncharacterized protein n=1 Tax=Spirobacillus cienkowskii TaxID=495820 RepID=A0A369KTB9_9BACT|nr:MAG: hypothetical protein DCC88_07410 [Spirobacillus cienkowskii]
MKNKFFGFVVLFVSYLIIVRAMKNKDSLIYKSVCSCAESISLMLSKFLESKVSLNDKSEKSKTQSNAQKGSD